MTHSSSPVNVPTFLVGATGTGKSAQAMELARGNDAAILAMDAMQAYCGVDIGTGKPTPAERAQIPHGGLDLAELGSTFDVAQYLKHADAFLTKQREAKRPVIIVGGTGLYFRALTRGLCEAPQGSEKLRVELNALSIEHLQNRLRKIDPAMLEQIDVANPRRLIRAIEVMEATGRSLRAWQDETPEPLVKNFKAFWIQREKQELSQRIAGRVDEMFSQGWVEEVRALVARYGMGAVKAFPGLGYREITEMLKGRNEVAVAGTATATTEAAWASVKSDIIVATRQYAKRQLTWFAREPTLKPVMLSGAQSFPADLLSLP